ncbi:zinc finger CCCH domain-containing protein 11 isoform X1 [Triticum dicoccoides]|uniref:zinc finger CCCH domain-containing protein 11 isoform X1 n=1 Tax=Triticum dicoccoides TaxID=85692 RepID=UPI0018908D2B|nr:zinc finger CCCH domain-containing protein 11 isoform X1 [Triticum dicoccoides]
MPPKKAAASKADVAKKQKVVEDKTFGLKNKNKSKNVQKYVQSLHQSVQPKPDPTKTAAKAWGNTQIEAVNTLIRLLCSSNLLFFLFVDVDADAQKKKEEEKAREKELNDLFKVAVSQPKVPVGVDPKSILCEFFKVGQCQKGFKCKFSHDLNVQRKGEKIDIYSDKRDGEEEDTMDDWDQETLEKVIASKNAEYQQNKPTDIVCKHFLDAVEKKQYGWFWVCPNGGKECRYRHALPPGYVLKSQMKALLEEESKKVAIEDEIEDQRRKVQTTTPMTTELFMEWKRRKAEEKEAGLAALRADRAKNDRMSGRELFMADASVFIDDAEAYEVYERREEPQANQEQGKKSQDEGPSSSTSNGKEADEEPDDEDLDDDDDLDLDELNELEASLSRTNIQIREPGEGTSS